MAKVKKTDNICSLQVNLSQIVVGQSLVASNILRRTYKMGIKELNKNVR